MERRIINKQEVIEQLKTGKTLSDLFKLQMVRNVIYKGDFAATDDIIYIPDIDLNEIPINIPLTKERLKDIEYDLYSGNDFINECKGNVKLAKELFDWCDWSHPSSAINDIVLGYEDDEFFEKFGIQIEELFL